MRYQVTTIASDNTDEPTIFIGDLKFERERKQIDINDVYEDTWVACVKVNRLMKHGNERREVEVRVPLDSELQGHINWLYEFIIIQES